MASEGSVLVQPRCFNPKEALCALFMTGELPACLWKWDIFQAVNPAPRSNHRVWMVE
jgi:hypothetical protein